MRTKPSNVVASGASFSSALSAHRTQNGLDRTHSGYERRLTNAVSTMVKDKSGMLQCNALVKGNWDLQRG